MFGEQRQEYLTTAKKYLEYAKISDYKKKKEKKENKIKIILTDWEENDSPMLISGVALKHIKHFYKHKEC